MAIAYGDDGVRQACRDLTSSASSSPSSVDSEERQQDDGAEDDEHTFLKDDLIVQQYIADHGATLFKVYAIGERRPSCRPAARNRQPNPGNG